MLSRVLFLSAFEVHGVHHSPDIMVLLCRVTVSPLSCKAAQRYLDNHFIAR